MSRTRLSLFLLERWPTGADTVSYDECDGMVVRAATEERARELASMQAIDEGADAWRNPKLRGCKLLGAGLPGEPEGVVLRDCRNG